MPKRLVICCDGTWSTADQASSTNVTKVARSVAKKDNSDNEQLVYYGQGVGTAPGERIRGGIFGVGLSKEVKRAYRFLAETFEPGDQLYFFGYSRGAFTARSTAGLVRNAGILKARHLARIDEAYALYRDRAKKPNHIASELFRRTYSNETRIRFIGVWDTVGALGIPWSGIPLLNLINKRWHFHDAELSGRVDAAFQALAIDEKRPPFAPSIWEQDKGDIGRQRVEQVWFAGVHSDVGGGVQNTSQSDIALRWMIDRAQKCDLVFVDGIFGGSGVFGAPFRPDPLGRIHESRTAFYKILPSKVRPIGEKERSQESASSTAKLRMDQVSEYRPSNLLEYLKNAGSRVTDVTGGTYVG